MYRVVAFIYCISLIVLTCCGILMLFLRWLSKSNNYGNSQITFPYLKDFHTDRDGLDRKE